MSESSNTEGLNKDTTVTKIEKADGDQPVGSPSYERKKRGSDPSGTPMWLVSFTDIMALMLTFFVMLLSMSKPDVETWSEISAALKNEFNRFYGPALNLGAEDAVDISKIKFNRALNLNYLQPIIESILQNNESLGAVTLMPYDGRLVLSLPDDLLFEPGGAEVKESGKRAIYALGGVLSKIKNRVEIVGHADPRPPSGSGGYDNNWSLSLARASTVGALLMTVGYEADITARGFSSGRYDDLPGYMSDGQKLGLARRVDIMIMSHDGSKHKNLFSIGGQ